MIILQGEGVSPGIAMGHVLKVERGLPPVARIRLRTEAVTEAEICQFDAAVNETVRQMRKVQESLERVLGREHSLMIQAHIMILQDSHFSGAIRDMIREERVNAEWAVKVTTEKIQRVYEDLRDPYLQEKIHDIQDISQRLLNNLSGRSGHGASSGSFDNVILISSEIHLSLLSELDLTHLKGFAVDSGGWTSHTSIIARSLKIPCAVHMKNITNQVQTGQFVILDGSTGKVYVDPDAGTIARFKEPPPPSTLQLTGPEILLAASASERDETPHRGLEGVRTYINTEFPHELDEYGKIGVDGVGLFRTEYLFLGRPIHEISFQDHEDTYLAVAEKAFPGSVNIRTFDLGPGRVPEMMALHGETNPAMGMRGIRLSLVLEDAFRQQLRGILRSSHLGNVRITFPFVSSIDEIRQAKAILEEVRTSLPGHPVPRPPIGCMLEIPSTFFVVGTLCDEADFFTLGTNDLVQFTLARDRDGSESSAGQGPAHPAVRAGLELIQKSAAERNREVICCGEMASHPFYLLLLLAIGFRSLSVNRPQLPMVRYIVKNVTEEQLQAFYEALTPLRTGAEIDAFFRDQLTGFFRPDFIRTLQKAHHMGL